MTFKSLALAAIATTMLAGAAIAQTDQTQTNSTGTQGSTPPGAVLEDQTKMKPFYSDEAMTTLRTGDEFTAAFNAMSSEDRERVRTECHNSTSTRAAFCESLKNIQ